MSVQVGEKRCARSGFTLLEILIVIGIIAALMGLLFPMIGQAREHSRKVTCMVNMRQIGGALMSYTAENDGFLCPLDYRDMVTPADANGYKTVEAWPTILVTKGYLPYPQANNKTPPSESNVLLCP